MDAATQMQAAMRPTGEPTEDELRLINRQAQVPLGKGDVYVFGLEISNDLRDSYNTRMDPDTTLRNYVDDFREGRSIQNSHRTEELPLARSFDAALERRGRQGDPKDPARDAVVIKGYVPRGINLNGVASDDLIRGIETGVVRDGSVHFDDGARYVCDICGNDMYERESSCPHLPGLTYGGKRAGATIVDGHALEASLVYDGSTPMAMIDKARRMAAAGLLSPKAVGRVEQLYRTRLRPATPQRTEEAMKPNEYTEAFNAGRMVGRAEARGATGAGSVAGSTVQLALQHLANAKGGHEHLDGHLGSLVTGIGTLQPVGYGRADMMAPPALPPEVARYVSRLETGIRTALTMLEGPREAVENAERTLRLELNMNMGSEGGIKSGLPDTWATQADLNPDLLNAHTDYHLVPAESQATANGMAPGALPGTFEVLGRSRRRRSHIDPSLDERGKAADMRRFMARPDGGAA